MPTACLRLSPPDFEFALLDPQLGREVGLIPTDLSLSLTSAPRPVMVLPPPVAAGATRREVMHVHRVFDEPLLASRHPVGQLQGSNGEARGPSPRSGLPDL